MAWLSRPSRAWLGFLAILTLISAPALAQDASPSRALPEGLAKFEYLIGSWKGTGVPTANRVRGWSETHAWAWAFEKGEPVALTAELTGNKVLTKARLTPAARGRYTLTGTDAEGKAVTFRGALERGGKALVLDRDGATESGDRQRITLFPNSNQVRYTLWVAEQAAGAPQFTRTVEVGVTKEGEAFAAGGEAASLPKCILTGGAATITVSYQGKSYPVCCTGCRDEFNENPEKYVKLAALKAAAENAAGPATAKPKTAARTGRGDDEFSGIDDAPAAKSRPGAMPKAKGQPASPEPAAPTTAPRGKAEDPAARAASLLRLGQNLEKSGKAAGALTYYRQIARDFPGTPAAKTAAERIKALGGR